MAGDSGKRRSRGQLEEQLRTAGSISERARAHYEMALFQDNNGREAEAIPHYEAALELGLPPAITAECLAWLASSLYKTGRPEEALQPVHRACEMTDDRTLGDFLQALERRIRVKMAIYSTAAARR